MNQDEIDWSLIKLLVFDVDGTLYRQSRVRAAMLRELTLDILSTRSARTIRVLSAYRRVRERLGDEEQDQFEATLLKQTATLTQVAPEAVSDLVTEWLIKRPLPYLSNAMVRGTADLFLGARSRGRKIAVLSDYPATAKLGAMGLTADHIVSACDPAIQRLKPDPRGLFACMELAGSTSSSTLMIGDRVDRDGLMAKRAGVRAIIRSSRPISGWQTFRHFNDPMFRPLLEAA